MKKLLFSYELSVGTQKLMTDLGLLILRVSVGLMMAFSHGFGKMERFMNAETIQFADPLGIGASASLFLAGGAEFFLSLFLVIGFMTRLSTIPLIFTMIVAVFIIHADDPFKKMEFGLLYLFPYISLLLIGPGKLSLDYLITKKN